MEEARDKLVIKWIRLMQGEVLKRVRGKVYQKKFDQRELIKVCQRNFRKYLASRDWGWFIVIQKKFDQRELIKVCQRNFRKYLASRDWGWFIVIQKTRATIGLPNPEEELRKLEEEANASYGKYKEALDVTETLKGSLDGLKEDIKTMGEQLKQEQ